MNCSCSHYWVTGQDVAQERQKWAEWAALANAANSAHFSISCATSCPVTLYSGTFKGVFFRYLFLSFFSPSLGADLSLFSAARARGENDPDREVTSSSSALRLLGHKELKGEWHGTSTRRLQNTGRNPLVSVRGLRYMTSTECSKFWSPSPHFFRKRCCLLLDPPPTHPLMHRDGKKGM